MLRVLRYTLHMGGEIVQRSELEKYRNLREAGWFIERVFSRIEKCFEQERESYRLSKGNYKYFSEEYIPIFRYLKFAYGLESNISFKHVGADNQPYDGVVKIGDVYKRIEIAYLYLGRRNTDELYLQIEKLVLDTARKKAKKPYGDTLLVLYYACNEDLRPGEDGMGEERFDALIDKLQGIKYHAKRVDFLIPSFEYKNADGKQIEPERLYRIK